MELRSLQTMSSVLFSAWLLINLMLLVHSGPWSYSPWSLHQLLLVIKVLMCEMAVPNMQGKCLVSPVVLTDYSNNREYRKCCLAQTII